LWNTQHHPDDVKSGLQESLDRLQLKYVDLYLIHWPIAFKVLYWLLLCVSLFVVIIVIVVVVVVVIIIVVVVVVV